MAGNRNSGRRPKPTSILKLDGTYRHGRHENRGVELAAEGEPVPPSTLKGEAKKYWQHIVPQLIKIGVAKSVDTDALVMLCRWWIEFQHAVKQIEAGDDRAFNRAVKASDKFIALSDRFGMTPTARARIQIPKKQDAPQDPAAKYFG